MSRSRPLLLIPVENQVRELDPKLLLACVAARRGFSSILGSRREMELNIDAFPGAIYLSKSMTVRSLMFFRVAHRLGHQIVAWDEEALVHLPAETYFSRRLHPSSIRYVRSLFAWGQDNADLWRRYPALPRGVPIHVIGNPRADMLRPQIRNYYQQEVEQLRRRYGNFILVNTNFNHVNAFGPDMNLFRPRPKPGARPRFGRAAKGMSRAYAMGLSEHKQALFESFKALIPALEHAFPDYTIVVRPHPTENHQVYRDIAARCRRVQVTNQGNIVPWLMASKVLIHNGCTTGVEAFVLGVPAVSYRARVDEEYDIGFYGLPNRLSHQCFDFEELRATLDEILTGSRSALNGAERQALVDRHLAPAHGPMACERIVDVLDTMSQTGLEAAPRSAAGRVQRWLLAGGLSLARRIKSSLPGSHNLPQFQQHRFPEIAVDDVRERVARLQRLLGEDEGPRIEKVSPVMFRVESQNSGAMT